MSLVVKPHRPWVTGLLWLLAVLALLIGGWSLFDYGRYLAGYDSLEMEQQKQDLLENKLQLEDKISTLREKNALLERAAQIERRAYDELDTTLKALQAEILELKEELAFYRGIVSPRDASSGLQLQSFKVEPNGKTLGYRYKVVLTQVLKNDQLATGSVNIFIDGLKGEEPITLELKDVDEKHVKELNFKFKYFQNIEGDMVLPEGYVPLRVTTQIIPHSRKRNAIEKTIEWDWQERKDEMGQEEAKADSTN